MAPTTSSTAPLATTSCMATVAMTIWSAKPAEDDLYGGAGNDTISGGADIDFIDGGFGNDVLAGGADQDVFAIGTTEAGDLLLLGNDTINGFQSGLDFIFMSDLIQGFGIDFADAFSGGYILLTNSGADTLIQFDKDGSVGGGSALTLATVTNATVAVSDIELGAILISVARGKRGTGNRRQEGGRAWLSSSVRRRLTTTHHRRASVSPPPSRRSLCSSLVARCMGN